MVWKERFSAASSPYEPREGRIYISNVYHLRIQADPELAEEFREKPVGRHGPRLQRLLHVFRSAPVEGKHVLVCLEPHRRWVLGRLNGPGEPVTIFHDKLFNSEAEGEWEVFRLRWELYTGTKLETV
jgi:hypothetical protein